MILSLKNFKISVFISLFLLFNSDLSYAKSRTNQEFIKELIQKVSQTYNVTDSDVVVEWKDDSLEKKLSDLQKFYPGKDIDLQIKDSVIKDISGKTGIPVDVNIDGKQNRIIYLRCSVDVLKEAVVANELIKKGEELTSGNIKYFKVPVQKIPKFGYLEDTEKLIGKIAMTDIKENTVITSNLLKEKIVVFRGNQVTIKIRNGDLILTSVGEALQDGYVGQNISVKVISFPSKRTVMAKILDAGLVEVILGGSN